MATISYTITDFVKRRAYTQNIVRNSYDILRPTKFHFLSLLYYAVSLLTQFTRFNKIIKVKRPNSFLECNVAAQRNVQVTFCSCNVWLLLYIFSTSYPFVLIIFHCGIVSVSYVSRYKHSVMLLHFASIIKTF